MVIIIFIPQPIYFHPHIKQDLPNFIHNLLIDLIKERIASNLRSIAHFFIIVTLVIPHLALILLTLLH